MRSLLWLRRDLRTRDNAALHEAARRSDDGVVAVFLLAPAQWRDHDEAACKVDFWMRNVRELSRTLADRNIPLMIETAARFADAPNALLKIARQTGCDALHFNREYEVNEIERDERVAAAFEKAGIEVHKHTDHVILPPGEVLTQNGDYFSVFTPFKKRWLAMVKDRGGVDVLAMPRRQRPVDVTSSKVPASIDGFTDRDVDPDLWPAGEDHARRRLEAFIEKRVGDYQTNRDFPAMNGTSTLSPYLAAGVISPRQCIDAAMRANNGRIDTGRTGIVTWISEIIWREFYQHVMVGFPRVCRHQPFRLETRRLRWNENAEHYAAWRDGRTGYPIVDAAMRQLRKTGWMHNRLRMIVAMFLSKHLLLDWRKGERHFMQRLIDGDLGSNNGGWQWSASTGTDAAPYFRIFNPTAQSEKFDAEGAFIREWVPELADLDERTIHDPSRLGEPARTRLAYPEPIVDHREARERALAAFKAIR